jgi:Na+-translocating ferredoxin:NAD+ oxidoreductase RnfG subunit
VRAKFLLLPIGAAVVFGGPAFATVYLTVEQAQALLFPGAKFESLSITLTKDQAKAIEHASGVDVLDKQLHVWRVSTGGWFIADEVVGKHEFIPFALALDEHGAVKGVEILEYREAYGGRIQDADWLRQFVGRRFGSKLKLDKDIRNISGATLSSKHVTDGVNRLLATYEIVLQQPGR